MRAVVSSSDDAIIILALLHEVSRLESSALLLHGNSRETFSIEFGLGSELPDVYLSRSVHGLTSLLN